jgi:hypothetical protein
LGAEAGRSNIDGQYNTSLGAYAGYNITSGTGNITIGYNVRSSATLSNALNIGNLIQGNMTESI